LFVSFREFPWFKEAFKEPGKTVLLEKQKVLELAERYKIAIVGYEAEPGGAR